MNPRRLWAVMRKDLLEVVGTGQVLLPMIIVPLVFVVILGRNDHRLARAAGRPGHCQDDRGIAPRHR